MGMEGLYTALEEELLVPWVLEHLGARDLLRLEVSCALLGGTVHLCSAWRRLGHATGAVAFSGGAVGEGADPKAELLRWTRARCAALLGRALQPAPGGWLPVSRPALRFGLAGDRHALVQTLTPGPGVPGAPDAGAPRGTYSVPQLPRNVRPVLPLAFGVRRGAPLYAEFRLSWEECGNGEACQVGLLPAGAGLSTPEAAAPAFAFSPSAGSIARYPPWGVSNGQGGSFRAWPLPDLWLDTRDLGTRSVLEAGVYIDPGGRVTFYRRGPLSQGAGSKASEEPSVVRSPGPEPSEAAAVMAEEAALPGEAGAQPTWEAAGRFAWASPAGLSLELQPEALHVALCLLDERTPLTAVLTRVSTAPPVPPPTDLPSVEWRWHAQA